MSNLLNIACLALSIYYVFTAPTSTPATTSTSQAGSQQHSAPAPLPGEAVCAAITFTTQQKDQIIDHLKKLRSAFEDTVYIRPLNKVNCTEELACSALRSIQELNDQSKLGDLQNALKVVTKGYCPNVPDGEPESTEDLNSFIVDLLRKFKDSLFNRTGKVTN